MDKIKLTEIDSKWQENREKEDLYKVSEKTDKAKFFVLDMFPYPSGSGLHVGHPKWYIATDVVARKKILEGFNVLHPMWWDAFGLPAENFAIRNKVHPNVSTSKNIEKFKSQLKKIGFTYDRSREINTTDPKYYKWTQWIFLKLFEHYYDKDTNKAKPIKKLEIKIKSWEIKIPKWMSKKDFIDWQRLAYIDYKPIIWCPNCKTGLAQEDLEDGKCERCNSEIEMKAMKQWRLLDDLDWLDERPNSVKEMQKHRIGRSEWCEFDMDVVNQWNNKIWKISVFTTRVDTVFSMAFAVIAPDHPDVNKYIWEDEEKKCIEYIEKAESLSDLDRTELKEKTWVWTGNFVKNPFNWEKVPLWIGDFVLGHYGTGAVFGDAHDERDFVFAKKYWIPLKISILPENYDENEKNNILNFEECFVDYGILINSGKFNGLKSDEAKTILAEFAEKEWFGKKTLNYKLRERVFSRQRYWGEPIPMIFVENNIIPLDEDKLPLTLPEVEHYEPTWTEEWPLANIDKWINVDISWQKWKRESNTMPQWAWSSWYWLRYMDPKNDKKLVDPEKEKYRWQVDVYVGGTEHATRHLIYARFWHKFLFDIGVVSNIEPFKKLKNQWMILAEDGRKMSKRWNNIVNPDDIIAEYGADTMRVYEMFMWPFEQEASRSTNWLKWAWKFLNKIINLSENLHENPDDEKTLIILNKTIKKITEDIDEFKFNTAIAQMMIFVNNIKTISKNWFSKFVICLAPFAPHLAEELWANLWNTEFIFKTSWPKFDEKYIVESKINLPVQINGKMRGTISIDKEIEENLLIEIVRKDKKLEKYLTGEPKKIIYIQWKILNIIV